MVDDMLCQLVIAKRNIETCATKGRAIVTKRLKKHIDTDISMANTLDLWTNNVKM